MGIESAQVKINVLIGYDIWKVLSYRPHPMPCDFLHISTGQIWSGHLNNLLRRKQTEIPRTENKWIARRLTIEEIQNKLDKLKPGKFKILTLVNTSTKSDILDLKTGKIFRVNPSTLCRTDCWLDSPSTRNERRIATYIINNGFDNPFRLESIKEKIRKTNLERYGEEYVLRNSEILRKNMQSRRKCSIVIHWKTGEELVCIGSYEVKTIEYLNENQIDFVWQPQSFLTGIELPSGLMARYTPDLYLTLSNTWVEIKGYFAPISLRKWTWFCSQYNNTELWDRQKLINLGILRGKQR